jgi:hypothetical protein
MVPPARPYPLIAPFRELQVLALLAAASSASVFAVVMRGAGGDSDLVRRRGGL